LWEDDVNAMDRWGRSYRELFYDTEAKMLKLKSLGYVVSYVWEHDAISAAGKKDPLSVLRLFEGKLEY